MTELSEEDRTAKCQDFLQQAGVLGEELSDTDRARVQTVVTSLGDRIKVASDILTYDCFFKGEIEYSEKDFRKRVQKEGVPELLSEFRAVLAGLEEWTAERLETELKKFVESKEVGAGLLIHALRISTTGSPIGPGVYDCLVIVGQETVLSRIDTALERAAAQ